MVVFGSVGVFIFFVLLGVCFREYYKRKAQKEEEEETRKLEIECEENCNRVEAKLKEDYRYNNSVHQIINDPERFTRAVEEGTITIGRAIETH